MKIISKDILTVESGVICQQVNCQGVMGSGLAKQIRDKWPIVYEKYKTYLNNFRNDFEVLGHWQLISVSENLKVCNFFGQLNYGYDGKRYTDYGALVQGFRSLNRVGQFYFPYNFGACRGGGDFNIIQKMIDFYFPNAIVCKL